jgi:poly-gamma-glutamate synthesis protein (capsule biosynthesis protein)
MTLTIGLLGDVMLGRAVGERIAEAPPEEVWSQEVRELCLSCDLIICNLECCISPRGSQTGRIRGKPFFFRAPPAAVRSLSAIGAGAAGLANNHAGDFGESALLDTLELLGEAEIKAVGAGPTQASARRGAIIRRGGERVGLVAVSDHPREYAAGDSSPGIAHAELDRGVPGWLAAELERLQHECSSVIAFAHWGPNMSGDTAPWQVKAATEMLAAGATLVAGHSAHVFHGVGWRGGSPLLFDLGDALDDYAVDPRLRNDLGVMALWRPGAAEPGLDLVGLSLDYCRTGLAHGWDAEWIAARLADACEALGSSVERTAEQTFCVTPA